MGVTLCVTTTTRYDLLPACLQSACAGTLVPDRILVIDQGERAPQTLAAIKWRVPVTCVSLGAHRGCEATAINYYLIHVPEERVIAHDDVVFGVESLARLVETPGAFVIDASQGVLLYRDAAIDAVGYYDPTLSPNYFRYVDVDYEDRLAVAGIEPVVVDCGIHHERDGTMKMYSPEELEEYHRRMAIAEANYVAKWGRPLTPGGSTIARAAWRRQQQHPEETPP